MNKKFIKIENCIYCCERVICILKFNHYKTLFYKSSGKFSKNKNIWFPIVGIYLKNNNLKSIYKHIYNLKNKKYGWFIKGYLEFNKKNKKINFWKHRKSKNYYINKYKRLKSLENTRCYKKPQINLFNINKFLDKHLQKKNIKNCNNPKCIERFMLDFFQINK